MQKSIKFIIGVSSQPIGEMRMFQPLPSQEVEHLDPFLLLHHHGPHTFEAYNQGLPFGPHPHRGFETLTYIYEGSIEHADSQGFRSIINEGGIQWMTAGRGIVHSENIPKEMREQGGKLEIIQLWMNLPSHLKMTPPAYQGFQKEEIPVVSSDDSLVKSQLISGEFRGQKGCAYSITELFMANVVAQKGGKETFTVPEDHHILFYVLEGELLVNGRIAFSHQLVEFQKDGANIDVEAQTNARFIIGSGKPFDEPIVSHGPFVMNSTTEILQAMRDYQMGKMGMM